MDAEDTSFARVLASMETLRSSLRRTGDDPVKLAEIDGWFRQHAAPIRRVRDLLEPDFD